MFARSILAVMLVVVLPLAPASALSTKECSVKYKAAKKAGTLNNQNWQAFRKAECAAPAKPEEKSAKAKPSEPKVTAGPAVYPTAVSPKFSAETPARQRMHTCLEQYRANKASGATGGLKWIAKGGGGYYSQCNKRLKG